MGNSSFDPFRVILLKVKGSGVSHVGQCTLAGQPQFLRKSHSLVVQTMFQVRAKTKKTQVLDGFNRMKPVSRRFANDELAGQTFRFETSLFDLRQVMVDC